jgi:D-arabinose 1-dehydrogenase-like Zn-dependent alcohol dehydrogenase
LERQGFENTRVGRQSRTAYKPIQFDAFAVVFQEKTMKGSLVATVAQVEDMLKAINKYEICSHIATAPLEKTPDLPEMHMDLHLKGR